MKELQVSTKQAFLSQFNGYLSIKNAKGTSFLNIVSKIAKISGCEELNLNQAVDWQFLKTEKGFIFAAPKNEYLVSYSSQLNMANEKLSSVACGYCLTLIWLSLLLGNVELLSNNEPEKEAFLLKTLFDQHELGQDEMPHYFDKKTLSAMYNILD